LDVTACCWSSADIGCSWDLLDLEETKKNRPRGQVLRTGSKGLCKCAVDKKQAFPHTAAAVDGASD